MNLGVFTTIKVKNGIPLFWDKHYQRLISQAEKLNLRHPTISLQKVKTYLKQNNLTDCALNITITKLNGLALKHRSLPETKQTYKLISIKDTRNYRKIYKTTDRAINEKAKELAVKKGADDAAFTIDENIIESTICNVFFLNKQGKIATPPIKARGLNGITRQLIMENTKILETDIIDNTKQPMVLVNCLRIQRVTHLNGKKLLDGRQLADKLKTIIRNLENEYLSKKTPA